MKNDLQVEIVLLIFVWGNFKKKKCWQNLSIDISYITKLQIISIFTNKTVRKFVGIQGIINILGPLFCEETLLIALAWKKILQRNIYTVHHCRLQILWKGMVNWILTPFHTFPRCMQLPQGEELGMWSLKGLDNDIK